MLAMKNKKDPESTATVDSGSLHFTASMPFITSHRKNYFYTRLHSLNVIINLSDVFYKSSVLA